MLFSSFEFIFYFFPVVVAGYLFLQVKQLDQYKGLWLLLSSVCFYLFWQWEDLIPLGISTFLNFALYRAMITSRQKKFYFLLGVTFNLLFLAWFKYPIIFLHEGEGIIPLGISFYTFTQIAFLVDGYRQQFTKLNFPNYALFVGYFPHLVCGPILMIKDFYPQLIQKANLKINLENSVYFLFFFSIGLFKKTFIADPLGLYVTSIFDAELGSVMNYQAMLLATLCYAIQLYADFSGYTDMAVGLSRLFGITIPFNFNSPYQSHSIIDFWRRWHMSLGTFLKNYIYIPLGGNRTTQVRNAFNLFIVLTLGGIWHGSSLTFLVWGMYHGALLALNHQQRRILSKYNVNLGWVTQYFTGIKVLTTFVLVCLGWVLFRSHSLDQAYAIFRSIYLFDQQGPMIYFTTKWQYIALVLGVIVAFFLPEPYHIYERLHAKQFLERKISPQIWGISGAISGVLLAIGVLLINKPQEFLYSGF